MVQHENTAQANTTGFRRLGSDRWVLQTFGKNQGRKTWYHLSFLAPRNSVATANCRRDPRVAPALSNTRASPTKKNQNTEQTNSNLTVKFNHSDLDMHAQFNYCSTSTEPAPPGPIQGLLRCPIPRTPRCKLY